MIICSVERGSGFSPIDLGDENSHKSLIITEATASAYFGVQVFTSKDNVNLEGKTH